MAYLTRLKKPSLKDFQITASFGKFVNRANLSGPGSSEPSKRTHGGHAYQYTFHLGTYPFSSHEIVEDFTNEALNIDYITLFG